jgi:hypothetical protein
MNALILMLLPALIQVESGGSTNAIGDAGKAYGALQVWDICVKEVNRVYGHRYTHEMMFEERHARNVAIFYLMHYGKVYKQKTGKEPTKEVLARIWNGGPEGYKKKSSLAYWGRVKKELDRIN